MQYRAIIFEGSLTRCFLFFPRLMCACACACACVCACARMGVRMQVCDWGAFMSVDALTVKDREEKDFACGCWGSIWVWVSLRVWLCINKWLYVCVCLWVWVCERVCVHESVNVWVAVHMRDCDCVFNKEQRRNLTIEKGPNLILRWKDKRNRLALCTFELRSCLRYFWGLIDRD